jgi:hypothetical protein
MTLSPFGQGGRGVCVVDSSRKPKRLKLKKRWLVLKKEGNRE